MARRTPLFNDDVIGIIGLAATGAAVAGVVSRAGGEVVAIDDRPGDAAFANARDLGIDLAVAPSPSELGRIVRGCTLVVVSPGVPPDHPVFEVVESDRLVSEVELASRIATVPIVAITGTNGKTTVTTLVNEMLNRSGYASAAAGNIGPALIEAVVRDDLDIIVAEVSSFQLALTQSFRPKVATWINFSPDHLDWHRSAGDYAESKSKIFAAQEATDVAVANAIDPVVMNRASAARSRLVTFARESGDYHVAGTRFVGPTGELMGTDVLVRSMPHDIENALAALATALEAGATLDGCTLALETNQPLAHRVEFVGNFGGVSFYDDSKATTPSAVAAALAGLGSTVLIAGGRNKGLDLSAIKSANNGGAGGPLRAVVAIGEAAGEIEAIFSPDLPVRRAASMDEAVAFAFDLSSPEDAVLLSPGCASFDWYRSYEERGRDFVRAVHELRDRTPGSTSMRGKG